MQPENLRFGGGSNSTFLNPIVAVAMVIAIVLFILLPRKYLIVPLFIVTFLIPLPQQIVILGLHVFVIRFVIAVGMIRMIMTGLMSPKEALPGGFHSLDYAFLVWALFRALATVCFFQDTGAVIYSCGFLWDALGGYFLLRFVIRDHEDVYRTLRVSAYIALFFAVTMLVEKLNSTNIFGFLGGVPIVPATREGVVRAQASFLSPIIAGAWGATVFPLFGILWKTGKGKFLAVVAALASAVIAVSAGSSTSMLGIAAGFLAICFWPFRKRMRLIRWGIVAGMVMLQLAMKAPIWWAIGHIDILGGNSNYHRANLIHQTIIHFNSWWLFGTNDNNSWGWTMWDLANEYVAQAVGGGLVTFVSFVLTIVICFRWLGNTRKAVDGDRQKEWVLWLLGATLFTHAVSFIGISYFDNIRMSLYALMAMISAVAAPLPVPATQTAPFLGPLPIGDQVAPMYRREDLHSSRL